MLLQMKKLPILLHKKHMILPCLIVEFHLRLKHVGIYPLILAMSREFYAVKIVYIDRNSYIKFRCIIKLFWKQLVSKLSIFIIIYLYSGI